MAPASAGRLYEGSPCAPASAFRDPLGEAFFWGFPGDFRGVRPACGLLGEGLGGWRELWPFCDISWQPSAWRTPAGFSTFPFMAMNRVHGWICSSNLWARAIETSFLPWVLEGIDLGSEVLEIGPGYGATTRVLEKRIPSLVALEIAPRLAARLQQRASPSARIVCGDGTAMPFSDAHFSGVACFTMLHHVPSRELQDRLFAEAHRVLRPGGTFAGSDSTTSLGFRLLHLADTMVIVDPGTLPARLEAAGFRDVSLSLGRGSFRFRARKPS